MTTFRPARSSSIGFAVALGFALLALGASPAQAAASFSTTDITWDVVGLDSNLVTVGPNHFPIGTRVCNTGDAPAVDVEATYVWDSTNTYINLRPGTATTLPVFGQIDLDPGECTDFFYEVEITRDPGAYDTARRYHVSLTANGGATTGSTEVPREVYVEHIISQSRNYVLDMQVTPAGGSFLSVPAGGTMTLLVGAQYDIKLVASTATNGYEQIETFINFPNIIFQVLSVETSYSAESSPTMLPTNGPCNLLPGPAPVCEYDALYGDGCIWEDDPLNPNYRSCLSVGKAGGDVTVTYRVQILSVPSPPLLNPEPLSTLIHDFSGSSYHYNADYGVQTRYAYILDPSTLDLTKSFVPSTIAPGGTSVLTIRIPNPTAGELTGVNFIDPLPSLPAQMAVAASPVATTLGCGTPTFAPTAGATSLSFSGATIAANSTCVITVNVTVPSAGTYTNTTGNLFINGTTPGTGIDTGNNASAVLTAATNATLCVAGQTMTQWTVPLTATNPPDTTGGVASVVAANVSSATASASTPAETTIVAGSITNAWSVTHLKNAPLNTLSFVVDTSNYSSVAMTWRWNHPSPANGPTTGSVVASAGGSGTVGFTPPAAVGWTAGPTISGLATSTTGTTTFTINLSGANNDSASLVFDDITFTGCSYAPPPQITKSFSPDPIVVGATSVLTFNITNPGGGGYDPMNLTNVSFSDTLPAGLLVGTPNGLSGSCGGGTITAAAGSSVISLTGASLAANGSCSFSVNVLGAAAGLHQNVSGYISATESGTNTTSTGFASDTLLVVAPPIISKAFGASSIAVGNSTSLSFTITNPNVGTALSGVAFIDFLPAGLLVHTPSGVSSDCSGGTVTAVGGGASVTLTGATLPALGSCSISLTVDGTTAGTKVNTTGLVGSIEGGVGNSATATLLVTAPNPKIALLKQVGPSASGPWTSFLSTVVGDPVYYRFTIENAGDVDLSPVTVTDPAAWVDLSSCTWPATLAVAPAVLPAVDSASCIVGPVVGGAVAGSHPNTATASGTYGSTTVTDTSTATYSTNQLTLVKAVDAISFNAAGVTLNYTYGVTNTGNVTLTGPITITDDKATVTCPGGNLGVGVTMVCTASYVTTAADVTAGQVTNIATAHALLNAPPVSSNTATRTVPFLGAIDLAISKTDGAVQLETGSTTVYTILVQNNGPSADGATLSDPAVAGLSKSSIDSCTAFGGASCPVLGNGLGELGIANLEAGTVVIPSLPNGGSLSITLTVLITSRAEPGVEVINVATVTKASGGLTEFNTSNNTDDDPNVLAHNWGHLPTTLYPTMNLYSLAGAYHLSGTTYFGAAKLTDVDGINTATYTEKPTDDGVTWTPNVTWSVASGGSIDVTVVCPGGTCYLNGWIDWNADGDFTDSGEKLFADNLAVTAGLQTLTFSIPSGALLDNTTLYSRFRLSDQPMTSPLPTGPALNGATLLVGEIEDPFFQVENGITTPVTVASFEAQPEGRHGVRFDWTTASESGNVGFDIYVQQGKNLVAVNEELIASKATDSLDRQSYSFRADVEGDTFFIEDVDIRGEARIHGPYLLGESYGGNLEDEKIAWAGIHEAHAASRAAGRAATVSEMRIVTGPRIARLEVRESGIQRVTYEALTAAGIDANAGTDKLLLTNRGVSVPIFTPMKRFGPGAYFEFYGEALDTIYTDANVYQLEIGNRASPQIQETNGAPGPGATPPASYGETYELNRQRAYANYAPSGDAWYDTSMLAFTTPGNWTIPFELDALADPSAATSMELVVWGVTDWPHSPDHHLVARVNGVEVADQTFDGLVEKRWTIDLPAGTLHQGVNSLELTLPGDTGAGWDLVNFDSLRVTHPRRFEARDGRLTFTADGRDFRVTNLPSKNLVVYRLDASGPRRLGNVAVQPDGTSYSATFAGFRRATTYFVSTASALHAPGIEPVQTRSDLNLEAEYLVISHPDFIDGLQPLVEARESQGLTVNVVDVNDIYGAYSFGVFDPQAIRDYIAHAAAELGTRSVLLVGGDTYDYRDYLGIHSLSFIPSLYASTGQFVRFMPSDAIYTDFDADGSPDLAIGRFPVRTSAELDLMVDKTLSYAEKSYGRTAFFAADRTDAGVSFEDLNAGLIQSLPAGWLADSVDLNDTDVPTAQTRLLAAMNGGTALVTYTGHSGPREWSFSHLFTTAHAAALTNAGQPFVVVQWGCWNTYSVDPVNSYLVQSFLFSGDRGAAAVLGAATLTDSRSEQLLGELLTPRLAIPGKSIGQALQEAKAELTVTHPELADVLLGWSLMGDPELVIEPLAAD